MTRPQRYLNELLDRRKAQGSGSSLIELILRSFVDIETEVATEVRKDCGNRAYTEVKVLLQSLGYNENTACRYAAVISLKVRG